jgi:DNA-binding SARP family transcriptional activator
LQLVRAALNDRDPSQVRAFISSLSGAEGHLYDYLAGEVIGDLEPGLQRFLMRTSLLETVDLVLGPVAAGVSESEARGLVQEGERRGLFGRGGEDSRDVVRAHPLVRDFLLARLERAIGGGGIAAIHRSIAEAADGRDWRAAAQHYIAAGEDSRARDVLTNAIETIVATGAFSAADDVMASLPSGRLGGSAEFVLRSRFAHQRADLLEGLRLAEIAQDVDGRSPLVLLTVIRSRSLVGDLVGAIEASKVLEATNETPFSTLGRTARLVFEASVDGSIQSAIDELEALADGLRQRDERHYLGVAQLNITLLRTALGDARGAVESANLAVDCLSNTSAGLDLVSARLALAAAMAFVGPIDATRRELWLAAQRAPIGQETEVAIEAGCIEAYLGDVDNGRAWLEPIDGRTTNADDQEQLSMIRALFALREGRPNAARLAMGGLRYGTPGTSMCLEARRYLTEGLVRAYESRNDALDAIRAGRAIATRQGARLWAAYGELLEALTDRTKDPSAVVERTANTIPAVLSMLAESTLTRVSDLSAPALDIVRLEAQGRPWRWRGGARTMLTGREMDRRYAGQLLSAIGEADDVARLRSAGRANHDATFAPLALDLARRLAPHAFVEDLGRVRIEIGHRRVDGAEVRRKVLALLCLLLTKPRYTSTREEVADALWPDLDPASALNSLNQTVYFLRRVFEPAYQDDTSPIYVGQDGETIWLDENLVASRSANCAQLIRSTPGDPTPDNALALAADYRGRFALDFAYEDWAAGFRDSIHAGYLRVMERAIQMDIDGGHFSRGTFLAERAGEVDPEADEIQAALVRLYRLSGSHAAAAEQYGRYSKSMQDLGLQPRPIEDL